MDTELSSSGSLAPNATLQKMILLFLPSNRVASVTELAREVGAPRPSVSRAFSVLSEHGLVIRSEHGLELTAKGLQEVRRVQRTHREKIGTGKQWKRGQREIQAGAIEAQKAASRNGHKPDYHRESLATLWRNVEEEGEELADEICKAVRRVLRNERDDLYQAVLSGNEERIKAELGDYLLTGIQFANHGGQLCGFEKPAILKEGSEAGA